MRSSRFDGLATDPFDDSTKVLGGRAAAPADEGKSVFANEHGMGLAEFIRGQGITSAIAVENW